MNSKLLVDVTATLPVNLSQILKNPVNKSGTIWSFLTP